MHSHHHLCCFFCRTNKGLVSRIEQLQRQSNHHQGSHHHGDASSSATSATLPPYPTTASSSSTTTTYRRRDSFSKYVKGYQQQQQHAQSPATTLSATRSKDHLVVEGIRSYFTEQDMQEFSEETRQILFGN